MADENQSEEQPEPSPAEAMAAELDRQEAENADNQQAAGEEKGAEASASADEGESGGAEDGDGAQSAAEAGTGDEAGTEEGKGEQEAAKPLEPPAQWSLEDQERFRKADPDWQQWFLDRSAGMEAAHTKRSQEVAPIRQAMDTWRPYFDAAGVPLGQETQAIGNMLQIDHALRHGNQAQKQQTFARLAADYGISLNGHAGGEAEGASEGQMHPEVAALRQEIHELRNGFQNGQAMAQQSRLTESQQAVRSFAEAKTEAGEPAHPYFAEVENDMAVLAQIDQAGGKQPDLKDLYERATWMNPSVRAKRQAAETAQSEAARKAAEQEKIQKAKLASVSVSGAGSRTDGGREFSSTREAVAAAFDAAGA